MQLHKKKKKKSQQQICVVLCFVFFSRSSWLPLLNPSSLLGRLSAWTPQLQQASCQAHFLKKHTNTHTQHAYKHKDTYEERDRGALCPQHTYKQRKIKCKVNVSPWVHLEWKHARLCRLKVFIVFTEISQVPSGGDNGGSKYLAVIKTLKHKRFIFYLF